MSFKKNQSLSFDARLILLFCTTLQKKGQHLFSLDKGALCN